MHVNKTESWYVLEDLFKISDRHHSPSFLYGKSPQALGRMITVMSSPAISGKEDFTAHFDFLAFQFVQYFLHYCNQNCYLSPTVITMKQLCFYFPAINFLAEQPLLYSSVLQTTDVIADTQECEPIRTPEMHYSRYRIC